VATETTAGWEAGLDLGYTRSGDRTHLARRRHWGPLMVQRSFYPEGGEVCHTYIIHPPGGVVGGDRLDISVGCAQSARALVTTPGATRFYRAPGRIARQRQILTVGNRACLEWLPQETILFDGANTVLETIVDVAAGGIFFGWEILCLGRPASDEDFSHGDCRQKLEIRRDGRLLLSDCARFASRSLLGAPWGLSGKPVSGMLLLVPASEMALNMARASLSEQPHCQQAATLVDGVLVVRCLADTAEQCRQVLSQVWHGLRPLYLDRPACVPRIWAT